MGALAHTARPQAAVLRDSGCVSGATARDEEGQRIVTGGSGRDRQTRA